MNYRAIHNLSTGGAFFKEISSRGNPLRRAIRFRIAVHCHEDIAYAIAGEGYESRVLRLRPSWIC